LIKVSGLLFGLSGFIFCLLLGLTLFFGFSFEAPPYIGDFIGYILFPMEIGLVASITGIVLGYTYFKLDNKVKSRLLTKEERNKWMIATLILFILFLFLKIWIFSLLIVPVIFSLIFYPPECFAEKTLHGLRPGCYR
jgi:cytochrome bd-type quinol oxidase subunit 2